MSNDNDTPILKFPAQIKREDEFNSDYLLPYQVRMKLAHKLMRNAIDLCMIARGEISQSLLCDVVNSAPRDIDERDSSDWRNKSLCWKLLTEGNNKKRTKFEQYDYDATVTFWMEEFCSLTPKTRRDIISKFRMLIKPSYFYNKGFVVISV